MQSIGHIRLRDEHGANMASYLYRCLEASRYSPDKLCLDVKRTPRCAMARTAPDAQSTRSFSRKSIHSTHSSDSRGKVSSSTSESARTDKFSESWTSTGCRSAIACPKHCILHWCGPDHGLGAYLHCRIPDRTNLLTRGADRSTIRTRRYGLCARYGRAQATHRATSVVCLLLPEKEAGQERECCLAVSAQHAPCWRSKEKAFQEKQIFR